MPTESIIREILHCNCKFNCIGRESTPFIEFMLEMILTLMQNVRNENVANNVPLKRLDRIVELMSQNRDITIIELANILEVADKTIKRDISKLKEQNKLARIGSLKSGYWEVKE